MKNVSFYFEECKKFSLDRKRITIDINDIIKSENFKSGKISVILCSDEYLLNINREYLKHDYYTDIITFNYGEDNFVSGDLFISVERVTENADEYGQSFENELYRVIYHGILHLVGFDDKEESSKKLMKMKEDFYLNKFKKEE
jgi:probable rRNA maturation factor